MQQVIKGALILLPILLIVYFLNMISNILLPFVVGIILAYFLDPAADQLEEKGFSRDLATLTILLAFIALISLFIYTVGPVLYVQTKAFISNIPAYIKAFDGAFRPYLISFYEKLGYQDSVNNAGLLKEVSEHSLKISKNLFSNILQSSLAVLNLFSLLFITPIVTFYLLRDWDKMMAILENLIPKKYRKSVKEQFLAIDHTLSGYIRGQTNVCILLGVFYAAGLSLVGLNHGFLIGFLTGVFSFIPYFGVFIGMFIGMAIAFFQFDSYMSIGLVLAVFLVGQFVEGNFVTPKLVGGKVGIHPVLIIFALLVGGALFGFLGILFAIPAIAVIGVLIRFMVKKYTKSKFFLAKS